jgi:hypothetical protein
MIEFLLVATPTLPRDNPETTVGALPAPFNGRMAQNGNGLTNPADQQNTVCRSMVAFRGKDRL